MPKRDAAYMDAQRDMIARSTLECLLDKGLYETSLRDICKRAGVSMGGLYIHFPTKEAAVVAACAIVSAHQPIRTARTNWDAYIKAFQADREVLKDQWQVRRARLSLQIAADLMLAEQNPAGLPALYERHILWIRESLKIMHDFGEIQLPIGLSGTANTHFRLLVGTIYMILSNKDIDPDKAWCDMLAAFAQTAGRTSGRTDEADLLHSARLPPVIMPTEGDPC